MANQITQQIAVILKIRCANLILIIHFQIIHLKTISLLVSLIILVIKLPIGIIILNLMDSTDRIILTNNNLKTTIKILASKISQILVMFNLMINQTHSIQILHKIQIVLIKAKIKILLFNLKMYKEQPIFREIRIHSIQIEIMYKHARNQKTRKHRVQRWTMQL